MVLAPCGSLVTTSVSLTEALLFLSSLHFDQLQAAISVNLHRYISTTLLQPLFHPTATSRSTTSCYLGESATLHFDYITTSSGYLSSTPPLHLDRVRAAISVNLQPAAVTRKIGGTVAHLRRCMGRRTSARGTSGIEVELILGTSRGASAGDVWWYKT